VTYPCGDHCHLYGGESPIPTSSLVPDGSRKNMVRLTNDEGERMVMKRTQNTMRYQQSEGNLALAEESLQVRQNHKDKTDSSALSLVPATTEEYSGGDALSPAVGVIAAIGLSIVLWCLIGLAIYWMPFSL
jgi:hypothetical protein